jgi:predicted NAD/FAD-dependent oxidoreductase
MPSVAIIGAGCSGLAASHELHDAGCTVTLFEKSSEVGGRVATRKREGFLYDYGAQVIRSNSTTSGSTVLIAGRFRAFDLIDIKKPVWVFDGHGHIREGDPLQNAGPQWTYRGGLATLPKRMAAGLDIRRETPIVRLRHGGAHWTLFDEEDHQVGGFERVLIAVTAPQAVELIEVSQMPDERREKMCALLRKATYNPIISVILGYSPAPQTRPYYALVNTDKTHAISWLAWEHEKDPMRVPEHAGLLIAQMSPQYSRDHWRIPDEETMTDVATRVATLLKEPLIAPTFRDIERWRDGLPLEKADALTLNALAFPLGLAFCGDAFVGGRIHLAMEHGIEVAQQLIKST